MMEYVAIAKVQLTSPSINKELSAEMMVLRYHFCSLVSQLFLNVQKNEVLCNKHFPLSIRVAYFYLFEEWAAATRPRRKPSVGDMRMVATSDYVALLDDAANRGMAAMLRGRIYKMERELPGVFLPNDSLIKLDSLFSWINDAIESDDDKNREIGCSALQALLAYNREMPSVLETVIANWYGPCGPLVFSNLRALLVILRRICVLGTTLSFWSRFSFATRPTRATCRRCSI